jgi:hypothetical protein
MKKVLYNLYLAAMTVIAMIVVAGFASRWLGHGSLFGQYTHRQSYLSSEQSFAGSVASASSTVEITEANNAEEKPVTHYRIQLSGCQATALTTKSDILFVKRKDSFIIENLDNVTRTVSVQGKKYKISPMDYEIITARGKGEYAITCNGKKAGVLNVQP